eukprot:671518-Prorocentrum_minimum.AAC.1
MSVFYWRGCTTYVVRGGLPGGDGHGRAAGFVARLVLPPPQQRRQVVLRQRVVRRQAGACAGQSPASAAGDCSVETKQKQNKRLFDKNEPKQTNKRQNARRAIDAGRHVERWGGGCAGSGPQWTLRGARWTLRGAMWTVRGTMWTVRGDGER